MSTRAKPDYAEEDLTDEAVSGYLAAHPDFFERNPKLLAKLRIPHETGGTVSLVERQVSMLRQKEVKLERQLRELIQVARDNDALAAKVHKLGIHLLAADSLNATVTAVERAVRSGFGADHAVLVLFGDPDGFDDVAAARFFRAIRREDEALRPFATFLEGSGPRCGQVRDSQRKFLFGCPGATGQQGLYRLSRDRQRRRKPLPSRHEHRLPGARGRSYIRRAEPVLKRARGRRRIRPDRRIRPPPPVRAQAVAGDLQALPA